MLFNRSGINKFKPYIRRLSRYKYVILLVYFLALVVYILSPILKGGNVCHTDFVSNLMRARFMNHNLTENLSIDGWTYMQYLGFQPFMFYFPGFFILINLIHILTFGLIPLVVAYKLLILASFLILPVSVYLCMRAFQFRKVHALFAAFFSLASGMVYGYGFKNLTLWGMDVQFFTISLIPGILLIYHRCIRSEKLNIYTLLLLSLLFATIAISHLQTTLHFILVLLFYNIFIFYQIKNKFLYIKKNLIILGITVLLISFWYFPVIEYYHYFGVLTNCDTDSLLNRTMDILSGRYLTIQPVAILFVMGLLFFKSKSRKHRFLSFFPITALVLFVLAADYFGQSVNSEVIRYLFKFFTTRSYPAFCLFLSFTAGYAMGEIIILINKIRFLLSSRIKAKMKRTGISQKLQTALPRVSGIIIIALAVFFVTVSLSYMMSFKEKICTESVNKEEYKPRMLIDTFQWLKDNAGKYDLIGQQYQMEPIHDMSGAGYLVSLQDYTYLPIFGGGHFEATDMAMIFSNYDNERFFQQHKAEYLHKNLAKFNMKYIVFDNRQPYLEKLKKYTDGFELVYENPLFSILEIKETNTMFISEPEKSNIKVLEHKIELERSTPRLTWKIENNSPGNSMTVSIGYFPKWKVYIDGEEVEPQKDNDLLLVVQLTKKGIQTVTIEYKTTFLETVFHIISLITLIVILGLFVRLLIIKRKELPIFKNSYWKSRFTKEPLWEKVFIFSVAAVGCLIIFLSLGISFEAHSNQFSGINRPEESNYANTRWQFSYQHGEDKELIVHNLVLLPNRQIQGSISENEDHWGEENGYLIFYTKTNEVSTLFNTVLKIDGKYVLKGKYLLSDNIIHILEQQD